MKFDGTVNLGHIMTAVVFIVGISGGWYLTDHRLSALERNFEKLSTVVVENARTEERIKDIGRRLDRLETR